MELHFCCCLSEFIPVAARVVQIYFTEPAFVQIGVTSHSLCTSMKWTKYRKWLYLGHWSRSWTKAWWSKLYNSLWWLLHFCFCATRAFIFYSSFLKISINWWKVWRWLAVTLSSRQEPTKTNFGGYSNASTIQSIPAMFKKVNKGKNHGYVTIRTSTQSRMLFFFVNKSRN